MREIKVGYTPKNNNEIVLTGLSATYCQQADSCADNPSDIQELTIKTEDAGGGTYFVLSSTRWAFDKIEDLIAVIRDFEKRVKT
jgi:hypothetical protein